MKLEETANFGVYDKPLGFKFVDGFEVVSNWASSSISITYIAKRVWGGAALLDGQGWNEPGGSESCVVSCGARCSCMACANARRRLLVES
jgi:hypothetical protein